MIKTIIKLTNDVSAKSGQLLVLHESGVVYTVNQDDLEGVFNPESVKKEKEEPVNDVAIPEINRKIDQMLAAGEKPIKIAISLGIDRKVIFLRRNIMIKNGLLKPKDGRKAHSHHWYKSQESLNAAKARGKNMGLARRNRSKDQ